MRHTFEIKLFCNKKRQYIHHNCVITLKESGTEVFTDVQTGEEIGAIDSETGAYSWEKENVGFIVSRVPSSHFLDDNFKKKLFKNFFK